MASIVGRKTTNSRARNENSQELPFRALLLSIIRPRSKFCLHEDMLYHKQKETGMKKFIYEELWLITGVLLGVLVGGLIEYTLLSTNLLTFSRYYIYLPTMIAGYVLGMWLGPVAWRKIYVEGTRGQKYVLKNNKKTQKS